MPRVSISVPGFAPQPYSIPLDVDRIRLGRAEDNDILIDGDSISSYHAELVRVLGGYELHDAGSTNGISLHGERFSIIPLGHDSVVQIGDVDFQLVLSDEEMLVLEQEAQPQVLPQPVAPVSVSLLQAGEPVPAAIPQVPISPQIQAPRAVPAASHSYQTTKAAATISPVLVVILAAAVFAGGLIYRYNKETGKSLIETIRSGGEKADDAAAPAEAAPAKE